MNPVDWAAFVKAIGELKTVALYTIAFIVGLWLLVTLIRSWWAHRNQLRQEELSQKEKMEAVKREEERELRLGVRLDAINNRTLTLCETTIKANTEALTKMTEVIKKCPGADSGMNQAAAN